MTGPGDEHDDMDGLDDLDDEPFSSMRTPVWRSPAVLGSLLLIGSLAGGWHWINANPSPDDLVKAGNLNVMRQELDEAIANYQAALALQPTNRAAHKGMSEAVGKKGDKDARAQWLEKTLALVGTSKQDRRRLRKELASYHLGRSKSLAGGDRSLYQASLEKTVEYDSSSEANEPLAELLVSTAASMAEKGGLKEAIQHTARVAGLNASRGIKEKALQAEVAYRVKQFQPLFDKEFKAKHQAKLIKSGHFDAKTKRIYSKVVAHVPLPRGATPKIHEVGVKNRANYLAKQQLLTALSGVAGVDHNHLESLPASVTSWEQLIWTVDWVHYPTRYKLGISIAYPDGVRLVYLMRHRDQLGNGSYKHKKKK